VEDDVESATGQRLPVQRPIAQDPALAGRRTALPGWIVDLAIGVALVASAFIPFENISHLHDAPLAVALFILAGGSLFVRRRWPLPVLSACLVIFGIAAAAGIFVTPIFTVPVAIAMFTVAAHSNRRRTIVIAAVAAFAVTLLSQLVVAAPFTDPRSIIFTLIVVIAAAAGDASKSRRDYLAAMTDRAVTAEAARESEARRRVAEDRLRIARDLHDVVAHRITVINLHANVASASLQSNPAEAEASLTIIREAARSTLTDIGGMLAQLRDSASDTDDPALRHRAGLDDLDQLVAAFKHSGFTVDRQTTGVAVELPAATDSVAYWVIQEALTNADKHGTSRTARLELDYRAGELTIAVENTVGLPRVSPAELGTGHGLVGVAERVESVDGRMRAGDTGEGTYRLTVRLPLPGPGHVAEPSRVRPQSGGAA
jgi:signal transduction histidine kinase